MQKNHPTNEYIFKVTAMIFIQAQITHRSRSLLSYFLSLIEIFRALEKNTLLQQRKFPKISRCVIVGVLTIGATVSSETTVAAEKVDMCGVTFTKQHDQKNAGKIATKLCDC